MRTPIILPAVIVFAKAPVPGRVKTRLGLPPEQAARLHYEFVEATLRTCAQLEARVELHTDAETEAWRDAKVDRALQVPGDLGDRMLAALRSRPAPVMIVGSDAPTLPADHLRGLLGLLREADVALGPTEDGGYYAIACRRTEVRMFAGVEWSTDRTLAQTVASCEACGLTVALGERWFDVDTPADLARI
ncbi:MAG: TIGR04282 family arsenosugar biosynthesis glycosyltransferase [Bryobacteraceae bacterium]